MTSKSPFHPEPVCDSVNSSLQHPKKAVTGLHPSLLSSGVVQDIPVPSQAWICSRPGVIHEPHH